jgi:hypothetical protein
MVYELKTLGLDVSDEFMVNCLMNLIPIVEIKLRLIGSYLSLNMITTHHNAETNLRY